MEARYFVIIITRHAEDRIKERTKLTPEDVKCLLENNAFCPLGKDEKSKGELFHLFFSRPDNTFFVAVLTPDKTFLQTVLCLYHAMPVEVKKRHQKIARQSYYKWFLEHTAEVSEEKPVLALLHVDVNRRQEFRFELGEVLESRYTTAEKLIADKMDLFKVIASAVDEWLLKHKRSARSINYVFLAKPEWSKEFLTRFTINHRKLLILLA